MSTYLNKKARQNGESGFSVAMKTALPVAFGHTLGIASGVGATYYLDKRHRDHRVKELRDRIAARREAQYTEDVNGN